MLLDAYEEIGDHIPLLEQYEDLMKRSPELEVILELIYKDILNFHQKAIRHFKNRRKNSTSQQFIGVVLI